MKISDMVQLIMAGMVAIVAAVAAFYQNWAMVGTAVAGAFAILRSPSSMSPPSSAELMSKKE
jgi:hypothetical protein